MNFDLISPFQKDLTNEENTAIDEYVDKVYEEFKDNGRALTKLALQASSAVTAAKAKANALAKQGFFKNLWGNITGKNRKIRGEIDRDFAVSIEASIRMITKLAQQQKLTFDAVVAINVKINNLIDSVEEGFNQVYIQMNKMMQMTMSALIRESTRVDKLERSMNVVQLESTIEYLDFNGTFYKDLKNSEKMLCIISDFFLATKGQYSISDLLMLKPMMSKVGITPDEKITMEDLYKAILENTDVANKFMESVEKAKINEINDFEIPLLGNIKKIELLETEEKYIVESIAETSGKDEKEVAFTLLKKYANNNLNMNLEKENSYFDLSVSIMNELKNIDLVEIKEEVEEDPTIHIKEAQQALYELGLKALENKDYKTAVDIFEKCIENKFDEAEVYEKLAHSCLRADYLEKAYNNFNLAIEKGLDTASNYFYLGATLYKNHLNRVDIFSSIIIQLLKKTYIINQDKVSKFFIELKKMNNIFYDKHRLTGLYFFETLIGCEVYGAKEEPIDIVFIKKTNKAFEIENEKNIIFEAFTKAIELEPNNYNYLFNLGAVYRDLEEYEKAIECYTLAQKIDAEKPELFLNKAEAIFKTIPLQENGEPKETITFYGDKEKECVYNIDRAIALDRNLLDIYNPKDNYNRRGVYRVYLLNYKNYLKEELCSYNSTISSFDDYEKMTYKEFLETYTDNDK